MQSNKAIFKKYKNLYLILSMILVGCFFSGCDKKDNTFIEDVSEGIEAAVDNQKSSNIVSIYYVRDGKIVAEEEKYQIKQPDSITASAEELMNLASKHFDEEKLEYMSYMIDEKNNIDVEFVKNGEMDKDEYFLVEAAFLKTLFQIKEICDVTISIEDANEKLVSQTVYTRDSFYFYDDDKIPYAEEND